MVEINGMGPKQALEVVQAVLMNQQYCSCPLAVANQIFAALNVLQQNVNMMKPVEKPTGKPLEPVK